MEALIKRMNDSLPSMMAPQLLTAAKSRRMGYLLSVKRRIASLKNVCDDPERQEQDELSTMTVRLADAWRKYKSSQQDVLGLITEDKVVDEQVTFIEIKETYEAAINKANAIVWDILRAEEGRNSELERAEQLAARRRGLHEQIMEIRDHVKKELEKMEVTQS